MKINIKSIRNDFRMPVFGLGTWMMGGTKERDPDNNGKADAVSIKRAIDAGVTHIDTAEVYAEGFSEEIVGRAIKGYNRENLFLVSKVYKDNLSFDRVIGAAKQSLERLGTDYLDLYLVHSPNPEISMAETMQAMEELKKQGLIKNIGVSNFNVERMREAQAAIKEKIVATQVHYNLLFREPEVAGLLSYCKQNGIMIIAWRPVQKGLICTETALVFKEICKKYNKTPAQIAINWLISQEGVVTLSTMRSEHHLEENLGALGWDMEQEDVERLRKEFPGQRIVSDSVPLG